MTVTRPPTLIRVVIVLLALWTSQALAGVERIYVLKEIDDDHIIIVTQSGEQLLLEKWSLRFSPLVFEGKYFTAEVSPLWVTIYVEGRDPLKWSVEKSLGYVTPRPSSPRPGTTPKAPAAPPPTRGGECYRTAIQGPTPFLGNGGEIILLADGTVWKEVSYQYLYLYEYYPSVIVCPDDGKMMLGRHVFQIVPAR